MLLGDLNLPGPLPRWLTGWQVLVAECTFPAVDPRVQLDHVLGHGDGLPAVTGGRAVTTALSDHCALLVDLADPAGPGTVSDGEAARAAD